MATKKKTDCRQYRIGDFARYLGVTAEFLKHYQESGLLDVTQPRAATATTGSTSRPAFFST